MKPKQLLQIWVERFNQYDYEGLSEMYSDTAINHQTPLGIVKGKENLKQFFKEDFALAKSEFVLVEDINIRDACLFEESKYKFTADESQNEVVYDSNNQRVLSSTKAGEFASYKEVLQSIYIKRKALKVNDPTNLPLLDKGKNTSAPLSGRFDMSSKITLGKK